MSNSKTLPNKSFIYKGSGPTYNELRKKMKFSPAQNGFEECVAEKRTSQGATWLALKN